MKKILLCICISFIILPIFVRGNQTPSTSSLTNPKTQVNYECEWPTNGVAASSYGGSQEGPQLVGDGEGGVIVAWSDKRSSFSDIYAQKINSTGSPQWDDNGTAICT